MAWRGRFWFYPGGYDESCIVFRVSDRLSALSKYETADDYQSTKRLMTDRHSVRLTFFWLLPFAFKQYKLYVYNAG